jgi:hypothetical protein
MRANMRIAAVPAQKQGPALPDAERHAGAGLFPLGPVTGNEFPIDPKQRT